jgi:hypothetical protein
MLQYYTSDPDSVLISEDLIAFGGGINQYSYVIGYNPDIPSNDTAFDTSNRSLENLPFNNHWFVSQLAGPGRI